MAHPSSAQNIVPMTQVCTIFSANRPSALFTQVPPACAAPNASCPLSLPAIYVLHVVGALFRDLRWPRQMQSARVLVSEAPRYLRTGRIISSTVDIVRQCRDALRLSKDHFGRSEKLSPNSERKRECSAGKHAQATA